MNALESLRYMEILFVNNRLLGLCYDMQTPHISHNIEPYEDRSELDSIMEELPDLELRCISVNGRHVSYCMQVKGNDEWTR